MTRKEKPPRQRRPVERPAEIVAAATDLFLDAGYASTSLDQIATSAGVTKGAIYHHFANKEEVLDAVIEACLAAAFASGDRLVGDAAPATVMGEVELVLRAGWDLWRSPRFRGLFGLVFFDPLTASAAVQRQFLDRGPRRGWALVAEKIREGQRRQEMRAGIDAEHAARLLVSGVALQALLLGGGRDAEDGFRVSMETIAALLGR